MSKSSDFGEVSEGRWGVETLADIIQTGNTPLTIGVFGGWGSEYSKKRNRVTFLKEEKFLNVLGIGEHKKV